MMSIYKIMFILIITLSVKTDMFSQNFYLAPRSDLDDSKSTLEEQEVEQFLKEQGMFSAQELGAVKDLEALATTCKEQGVPRDFKNRIETYINNYRKSLTYNISLYKAAEKIYLDYPHKDTFKEFIYNNILLHFSTSLSISDAEVIFEDEEIKRQTDEDRLLFTDHMLEPYFRSVRGEFVYYDIGASFGTETYRSYQRFKSVNQGRATSLNFTAVDRNVYQYVIYETESHRKIFFNALGQPVAYFDVEEGEVKKFDYGVEIYRYAEIFETLRRNAAYSDKKRFFKQPNYVLETIPMIDPNILYANEQEGISYHQHDARNRLPEQFAQANVIRIFNLLQYFPVGPQTRMIAASFNDLKKGGYLVFNVGAVAEDIKYYFVLHKAVNGDIIVHAVRMPGYERQSLFERLGGDLLNNEINQMKQIMDYLFGENAWTYVKGRPSFSDNSLSLAA